jgi:hypothetical protein
MLTVYVLDGVWLFTGLGLGALLTAKYIDWQGGRR